MKKTTKGRGEACLAPTGLVDMKLSELVSEDLILPSLTGNDVPSVLQEFAQAVCAAGKFSDSETLYERLYEREKQESTGIGNGVAIPHCKVDNLQQVLLAIGYAPNGVDFKASDGNRTYFFFLVVSPSSSSVLHMRTLAALSRLLRSSNFISHLQQSPDKQELIALIKQEEEKAAITT